LRKVLIRILFLLVALQAAAHARATHILRFSPEGKARQVQQVSARFSEPVTALGDAAAASPFTVECPFPGQGRWVTPAIWTYEFERVLPAGQRCRFTLASGLLTLAGNRIEGKKQFEFDTGPLRATLVEPTLPASERQVFALGFNGLVDPHAALAHMHCET
jgi:alpha-2-macroglobulin